MTNEITCNPDYQQLYAFFSSRFEFVPQPVGQILWGHVRTLLFCCARLSAGRYAAPRRYSSCGTNTRRHL